MAFERLSRQVHGWANFKPKVWDTAWVNFQNFFRFVIKDVENYVSISADF